MAFRASINPPVMGSPSPLSLTPPGPSYKPNVEQTAYESFKRDHRRELKAKPPKHCLQDDSPSATSWNTAEVGYFDGETKRFRHIEHERPILLFHHVVAFVNHLRALSVFRTEDTLRCNIHSCLRGKALEWFISELTQHDRESLRTLSLEEGWFRALEARFKPCTLANEMLEDSWDAEDWINARSEKVLLAHDMLRHLEVAKPKAYPVQWLRKLWRQAPMNLQDKIPEPQQTTSVLDFMSSLDQISTKEDHQCGYFREEDEESN